ncbi:hypothetical protein, partial [Enterococcus sp.]|uniref:hypothetical protein n=1 Tax=Enterococcus sp. TaxID=35783 RepID=UPI00289B6EEB
TNGTKYDPCEAKSRRIKKSAICVGPQKLFFYGVEKSTPFLNKKIADYQISKSSMDDMRRARRFLILSISRLAAMILR